MRNAHASLREPAVHSATFRFVFKTACSDQTRFPADFMFKLMVMEKAEAVANCDHLQELKFSPGLSNAFTEPVAPRYLAPRQIP
jgi:hypothetical protein